jgi:hypothetical protein
MHQRAVLLALPGAQAARWAARRHLGAANAGRAASGLRAGERQVRSPSRERAMSAAPRRLRFLAPALLAAGGSVSTYAVLGFADALFHGRRIEAWLIILLLWVAVVTFAVALPSAAWMLRPSRMRKLPSVWQAVVAGALVGFVLCWILDRPSVDWHRWEPYAAASAAGCIAGGLFWREVSRLERRTRGPEDNG